MLFKKVNGIFGNALVRTGIWSIIGTFLIKAVNLISIPVFSRMLSTSEFGEVNLFMTYVTIFSVLLGLDFNATVSKGSIDFKDCKETYEASSLAFTGLFALIVFVICNIGGESISSFMKMNPAELNLLIVYSYAMFVVSYYSADYIFQFKYRKNTLLSVMVVTSNFLLSICFILTFFSENKYYGRIIGAAIPTVIIASILFVKLIWKSKHNIRWQYIRYSIKLSVPLIPHHLSGIILSQSDKIMISAIIGKEENGIYSLVYNVGWMLSVLLEALNNVWIPWTFRKMEENQTGTIKRASIMYLSGFSVATVLIGAISPEIVKMISPESYWEGIEFVIWIVFSTYIVFLYYFYVNIELFYKKNHLVSTGTVAAAIINILLNLWGLNKFGYGFAAISTTISYFALFLFHFIIVNFIIKKKVICNNIIILFLSFMFLYSIIMQMSIGLVVVRIAAGICSSGLIVVFYFSWKKQTNLKEVKGRKGKS